MFDQFQFAFQAMSCRPFPVSSRSAWTDHLPTDLLQMLESNGCCGYNKGNLWLCDPTDFEGVLEEWGIRLPNAAVIARSAFGKLFILSNGMVWFLDIIYAELILLYCDVAAFLNKFLPDPEIQEDLLDQVIFEEAYPPLGDLKHDECYGFVPLPVLGGPGTADSLRVMKLREYLAINAQLVAGDFSVVK